ncbi:MAG: carbohydrate kinase family protein [Bacilli bacterium]
MKVLCIGHACYDVSYISDEYPEENNKYRINNSYDCGGGSAENAAYLLGKWEVETYFQGKVGRDTFGRRILEELSSVNVDTSLIEVSSIEDTSISFVIINQENGSRTLFDNNKSNSLKLKEYDFTPDIILVDGTYPEISSNAINKFPNAISVIDADKVSDEVIDLCKKCNYVICSSSFGASLTNMEIDYKNTESLKNMYEELSSLFEGTVIVTLEEHGCIYKINNKIKLMSALKVKVEDTCGSGDIFHGAFVYGLSKGLELEKCLKIANITASLSVTKVGVKSSIPELLEVHQIYEKNR